jgi:predicted enzyme related to lactoylglutathione lyase
VVSTAAGRLSKVLYPVVDLGALVAFYQDAFGLCLRFRDGDRYAEFDRAEVSLALTAGGESVAGSSAALSICVPDVDAALDAVRLAGGVTGEVTQGPHERRALVHDPAGNPLVVYSTLPQS